MLMQRRSKDTDDSPSDNPEEEGEAEVQRKKKCCSCRTPRFILRASDSVINFLDRHTYSSLWEVPGGRPRKIWTGVYKVYQKYSYVLCYLAFMINAVVNADLLSLFYPISMFIYALLEIPRPHKVRNHRTFCLASSDSCILLTLSRAALLEYCLCVHSVDYFGQVHFSNQPLLHVHTYYGRPRRELELLPLL
jgi:hypothetical protein